MGLPIIGIVIANNFDHVWLFKYKKFVIAFFAIYNLLLYFKVSLKGDFADYIILSIEYFVICLFIFSPKKHKEFWIKLLRVVAITGICIGTIVGGIGIFLFPIISQDYTTDKIFYFEHSDKLYETRRYRFGTIGSVDTRYTFNTYRIFSILPFEYKIDKTDFSDLKTNLNISDPNLKIDIIRNINKDKIKFSSTDGKEFTKSIN
ncbi:hypothetical protein [Mucilaginibacter sp.]|uniref:hypothetical protein n=1 Tax=Mucilaginibacter sp. TaxID=1882438 RepID=UPI003AFFEE5B